MAPEQAKGEAVDQRADVYAFGLILRDMLLGSRRGGAQTEFAELMLPDEGLAAPMRAHDATIPEPLDALVTRCLQPDPAARYQTSAELLKDLERVAEAGRGEDVPREPERPQAERRTATDRRPRVPIAAAAAVLLVVVAIGVRRHGGGTRHRAAAPAAEPRTARRSRWPCSRSETRRATRRSIRSARA